MLKSYSLFFDEEWDIGVNVADKGQLVIFCSSVLPLRCRRYKLCFAFYLERRRSA